MLFEEVPNINLNFSLLEKIVLKITEGTITSKEETLEPQQTQAIQLKVRISQN